MRRYSPGKTGRLVAGLVGLLLLGWIGVVAACGGPSEKTPTAAPAASPTASPSTQQATPIPPTAAPAASPTAPPSTQQATPVPLKVLKLSPVRGPVGTSFTLSGEGLPPGKTVEFQWDTVKGSYRTELNNNRVEFYERVFTPRRVSLGHANTDAQGRFTASFNAPQDYGVVHDIYAVVDGTDLARGGFQLQRTITMTPQQGPVGTLITFEMKGLGWKPFESTLALRYDNKYTGFISATTGEGSAVFKIRAAGPVGKHVIEIAHASHAQPYLNWETSPVAYLAAFRFDFTVTGNPPLPQPTLEWPEQARIAIGDSFPRTTIKGLGKDSGVSASLSQPAGPILSRTDLTVKGLLPEAPLGVLWMTVSGNDVFGWNLAEESLAQAKASKDGTLETSLQIPDDLGGWHAIRLVSGEKVVAEVPYFVERSLVEVTPTRVKAGEKFTVHLKGVGWTELDNGVAVTYDNAYIGYACGFCCKGDVTVNLVATGGPGVHLIDLYPMIYDGGYGKYPWQYQLPQLTAAQDHPSLALGYRLPIFRLAVEVVE